MCECGARAVRQQQRVTSPLKRVVASCKLCLHSHKPTEISGYLCLSISDLVVAMLCLLASSSYYFLRYITLCHIHMHIWTHTCAHSAQTKRQTQYFFIFIVSYGVIMKRRVKNALKLIHLFKFRLSLENVFTCGHFHAIFRFHFHRVNIKSK